MSAQTLLQVLRVGGSLRYRPPNGFYAVLSGKAIPVHQAEAQAAVKANQVRPAGIDQHGVYLFTLSHKARNAMPSLPDHPQALPQRPAAAPPALPGMHPLRRAVGAEVPAPVPAHGRAAPGQVPAGSGRLDGAGEQRERVAGAGQGCVGCGACAGKGVTA